MVSDGTSPRTGPKHAPKKFVKLRPALDEKDEQLYRKKLESLSEEQRRAEYDMEKSQGNNCFNRSDFSSAIQHYTRSILCEPTCVAYSNRAQAYLKLNQYTQALADCNEALKLNPASMKTKFRRGLALQHKNLYREALLDFEEVVRNESKNFLAKHYVHKLREIINSQPKKVLILVDDEKSPDDGDGKKLVEISAKDFVQCPQYRYAVPVNEWRFPKKFCACTNDQPDFVRKYKNVPSSRRKDSGTDEPAVTASCKAKAPKDESVNILAKGLMKSLGNNEKEVQKQVEESNKHDLKELKKEENSAEKVNGELEKSGTNESRKMDSLLEKLNGELNTNELKFKETLTKKECSMNEVSGKLDGTNDEKGSAELDEIKGERIQEPWKLKDDAMKISTLQGNVLKSAKSLQKSEELVRKLSRELYGNLNGSLLRRKEEPVRAYNMTSVEKQKTESNECEKLQHQSSSSNDFVTNYVGGADGGKENNATVDLCYENSGESLVYGEDAMRCKSGKDNSHQIDSKGMSSVDTCEARRENLAYETTFNSDEVCDLISNQQNTKNVLSSKTDISVNNKIERNNSCKNEKLPLSNVRIELMKENVGCDLGNYSVKPNLNCGLIICNGDETMDESEGNETFKAREENEHYKSNVSKLCSNEINENLVQSKMLNTNLKSKHIEKGSSAVSCNSEIGSENCKFEKVKSLNDDDYKAINKNHVALSETNKMNVQSKLLNTNLSTRDEKKIDILDRLACNEPSKELNNVRDKTELNCIPLKNSNGHPTQKVNKQKMETKFENAHKHTENNDHILNESVQNNAACELDETDSVISNNPISIGKQRNDVCLNSSVPTNSSSIDETSGINVQSVPFNNQLDILSNTKTCLEAVLNEKCSSVRCTNQTINENVKTPTENITSSINDKPVEVSDVNKKGRKKKKEKNRLKKDDSSISILKNEKSSIHVELELISDRMNESKTTNVVHSILNENGQTRESKSANVFRTNHVNQKTQQPNEEKKYNNNELKDKSNICKQNETTLPRNENNLIESSSQKRNKSLTSVKSDPSELQQSPCKDKKMICKAERSAKDKSISEPMSTMDVGEDIDRTILVSVHGSFVDDTKKADGRENQVKFETKDKMDNLNTNSNKEILVNRNIYTNKNTGHKTIEALLNNNEISADNLVTESIGSERKETSSFVEEESAVIEKPPKSPLTKAEKRQIRRTLCRKKEKCKEQNGFQSRNENGDNNEGNKNNKLETNTEEIKISVEDFKKRTKNVQELEQNVFQSRNENRENSEGNINSRLEPNTKETTNYRAENLKKRTKNVKEDVKKNINDHQVELRSINSVKNKEIELINVKTNPLRVNDALTNGYVNQNADHRKIKINDEMIIENCVKESSESEQSRRSSFEVKSNEALASVEGLSQRPLTKAKKRQMRRTLCKRKEKCKSLKENGVECANENVITETSIGFEAGRTGMKTTENTSDTNINMKNDDKGMKRINSKDKNTILSINTNKNSKIIKGTTENVKTKKNSVMNTILSTKSDVKHIETTKYTLRDIKIPTKNYHEELTSNSTIVHNKKPFSTQSTKSRRKNKGEGNDLILHENLDKIGGDYNFKRMEN